MSADDVYSVAKLDDKPGWGIFWSMGDDYPASCLSRDSRVNYDSPIAAILAAHRINRQSPAEYGVYVGAECLEAAEEEMRKYARND